MPRNHWLDKKGKKKLYVFQFQFDDDAPIQQFGEMIRGDTITFTLQADGNAKITFSDLSGKRFTLKVVEKE